MANGVASIGNSIFFVYSVCTVRTVGVADGLIKSNICIVLYEIFFLLIFFNPLLGIFTGYITT